MNEQLALLNQDIAAHRFTWCSELRSEHTYALRAGYTYDNIVLEFVLWSAEHMDYSKRAMKEMGITEEDQFYA